MEKAMWKNLIELGVDGGRAALVIDPLGQVRGGERPRSALNRRRNLCKYVIVSPTLFSDDENTNRFFMTHEAGWWARMLIN